MSFGLQSIVGMSDESDDDEYASDGIESDFSSSESDMSGDDDLKTFGNLVEEDRKNQKKTAAASQTIGKKMKPLLESAASKKTSQPEEEMDIANAKAIDNALRAAESSSDEDTSSCDDEPEMQQVSMRAAAKKKTNAKTTKKKNGDNELSKRESVQLAKTLSSGTVKLVAAQLLGGCIQSRGSQDAEAATACTTNVNVKLTNIIESMPLIMFGRDTENLSDIERFALNCKSVQTFTHKLFGVTDDNCAWMPLAVQGLASTRSKTIHLQELHSLQTRMFRDMILFNEETTDASCEADWLTQQQSKLQSDGWSKTQYSFEWNSQYSHWYVPQLSDKTQDAWADGRRLVQTNLLLGFVELLCHPKNECCLDADKEPILFAAPSNCAVDLAFDITSQSNADELKQALQRAGGKHYRAQDWFDQHIEFNLPAQQTIGTALMWRLLTLCSHPDFEKPWKKIGTQPVSGYNNTILPSVAHSFWNGDFPNKIAKDQEELRQECSDVMSILCTVGSIVFARAALVQQLCEECGVYHGFSDKYSASSLLAKSHDMLVKFSPRHQDRARQIAQKLQSTSTHERIVLDNFAPYFSKDIYGEFALRELIDTSHDLIANAELGFANDEACADNSMAVPDLAALLLQGWAENSKCTRGDWSKIKPASILPLLKVPDKNIVQLRQPNDDNTSKGPTILCSKLLRDICKQALNSTKMHNLPVRRGKRQVERNTVKILMVIMNRLMVESKSDFNAAKSVRQRKDKKPLPSHSRGQTSIIKIVKKRKLKASETSKPAKKKPTKTKSAVNKPSNSTASAPPEEMSTTSDAAPANDVLAGENAEQEREVNVENVDSADVDGQDSMQVTADEDASDSAHVDTNAPVDAGEQAGGTIEPEMQEDCATRDAPEDNDQNTDDNPHAATAQDNNEAVLEWEKRVTELIQQNPAFVYIVGEILQKFSFANDSAGHMPNQLYVILRAFNCMLQSYFEQVYTPKESIDNQLKCTALLLCTYNLLQTGALARMLRKLYITYM